MMTQQLRAGILSAPLAAIDRRVLSQAWYCALGFARERAPAGERPGRARLVPRLPEQQPRECAAREIRTPASHPGLRACPAPRAGTRDAAPAAPAADRRAPAFVLARAIERRFARTPAPPARATFALDGGRVHVILRSRGQDVRLIALCAPAARATVARALDAARYALAARGIGLGVERVAASGRQ